MGKRQRVNKSRKGPASTPPAGQKKAGPPSGRPNAIQDVEVALNAIEGIGQIHGTKEECAAFLNISYDTLLAFFKKEPRAEEAYQRGKEAGKLRLRRYQMQMAEKNATMAIFLGMNLLGQEDKRNLQHGGKVQHEHTVIGALLDEIDAAQRERDRTMIDVTPEAKDAA